MSEIHYTANKKIIVGDVVTEITDRNAFISSGGTAHYENCAVVTRMLSGTGGQRMAHRSITTADKAHAGIKSGAYLDCAACNKIANKRTDEYTQNAQLIPSATNTNTNTKENNAMSNNTNTDVALPDGVKDTPSTRTVYTAMLNGAHGTVTEIAKTSGVTATSVKRALTALTDAGAATLTPGHGTGPSRTPDSWNLADVCLVALPGEEIVESSEDTTDIPGLGAIPTATLNILATGDPAMSGNEKRVRDLLAKTFKIEWTALTDPQQATIVMDFMAGEQAEPESFDAKSYSQDIGKNNLLTYANSVMNADMGERVLPDDDDDMVDADDEQDDGTDEHEELAEEERQAKRDADDADLEDGWNSSPTDLPEEDDEQDDGSEEEEPQQVVEAPKPVKRVAKPKLKAAGVKKGQAYGYLSGTGLAHTAKCASVKAAELGTLNIPMGSEYKHPLSDLLELVLNGDIKECRLCAKLRRTAETKQVDVAKFTEFVRGMATAKREDAPLAKTFSGFVVTVSGTTKSAITIDLRGPASNQWSRRKDIEKKNLNRAVQDLVKEITSK